jgi:hypothetical protein
MVTVHNMRNFDYRSEFDYTPAYYDKRYDLRKIEGVDLVAVFLLARQGIKGGETRVFEADGPNGQRFTLDEPWSVLLLDDARVIHESTPIQPLQAGGYRDTLVVTLRATGFQGD